MKSTCLLATIIVAFAQCGDSTDQSYQPDRPLAENCRRYASRYTLGSTVSNCTFEPAALSIFCDDDSANPAMGYNTLADFINEPKVLGRFLRKTSKGPMYYLADAGIHTYHYDTQGRLAMHQATEWPSQGSLTYSESETFNNWDTQGRPTTGTYFSGWKTFHCQGLTSWMYDDANYQLTVILSMLQGDCPPNISTTLTYDKSGIITAFGSRTYDIQTTMDVCN